MTTKAAEASHERLKLAIESDKVEYDQETETYVDRLGNTWIAPCDPAGWWIVTKATTVPTKATTVPTKATTVPTKATTVPTKATTVPTKATTVPTKATTVPTKATTVRQAKRSC